MFPQHSALLVAFAILLASPAKATWSIIAVDTETQEVAVGSATCVPGLDLAALLPVVIVGEGGGAAQSFGDSTGQRRQIIRDGVLGGLTAEQIVTQLEALPNASFFQHGVAETGGSADTQTGATNGPWAGGNAGSFGSIFYAIQGNVLTGQPVVDMATQTFVDTVGDLPAKLMAAMETARAFGGDGRCSCSPANPEACGSPPARFDKSADVGFIIVSRFGDTDDPACTATGCADGDYFLDLNVANQTSLDPDPVLQLQTLFDTFRANHIGRPDAVASSVSFTANSTGFLLTVALDDWQGNSIGAGVASLTVTHAPDSDAITDIDMPVNNGDGTYSVQLDWDGSSGTDVFRITADDGIRPVVLPPRRATLALEAIFIDGFESGDALAWSSMTRESDPRH